MEASIMGPSILTRILKRDDFCFWTYGTYSLMKRKIIFLIRYIYPSTKLLTKCLSQSKQIYNRSSSHRKYSLFGITVDKSIIILNYTVYIQYIYIYYTLCCESFAANMSWTRSGDGWIDEISIYSRDFKQKQTTTYVGTWFEKPLGGPQVVRL